MQYVHHRDGDPRNNAIDNLELRDMAELDRWLAEEIPASQFDTFEIMAPCQGCGSIEQTEQIDTGEGSETWCATDTGCQAFPEACAEHRAGCPRTGGH
jgi:hypothetical protein